MTYQGTAAASGDALSMAASWIAGTLTGSAATIVAVLAVAAAGLLMLGGRLPARHGARLVLGCCILFSAGAIAQALVSAASAVPEQTPSSPPPVSPVVRPLPSGTEVYDPYSGVAVPGGSITARDLP